MIIYYINLDEANLRQEALENSFKVARGVTSNWRLARFPAISYKENKVKKLPGTLSNKEKACLLGHYEILINAEPAESYLWIMEDDSIFCEQSFKITSAFFENYKDLDWDILYTAIDPRSPEQMFELFFHRQSLDRNGAKIVNIENMHFTSSSSYIVNLKNFEKIKNVILTMEIKDRPWDLFLSDCINYKKLKAYVTVPFATKLSPHTMQSQIENDDSQLQQLLLYCFRALMNRSCDITELQKQLTLIGNNEEKARLDCFGKIIASFAAKNFRPR